LCKLEGGFEGLSYFSSPATIPSFLGEESNALRAKYLKCWKSKNIRN